MKILSILSIGLGITILSLYSCKGKDSDKEKKAETAVAGIKEESTAYAADSVTMNGFVAYDSGSSDKRPVVIIIHEWWGLNDYTKMRARELAKLGYFAFAIDMFGNGKTADNPKDAEALVMPFYTNPSMAKLRFDAAVEKIKSFPQADAGRMAAIGYCFGGAQVLNLARMGEDLKGVVSFHGNLVGVAPDKSLLKAKVLVCQGGADPFVPMAEVEKFKKQMDSVGADYTVKVYDSATHSFTNPNATATGEKFKLPIKYNPAADSSSWKDMRDFFDRVLGKVEVVQ